LAFGAYVPPVFMPNPPQCRDMFVSLTADHLFGDAFICRAHTKTLRGVSVSFSSLHNYEDC
jgi:hypothetical protein